MLVLQESALNETHIQRVHSVNSEKTVTDLDPNYVPATQEQLSSRKKRYNRFMPIDRFQDFCEFCISNIWFWTVVFLSTVSEPILCSWNTNVGHVFVMQQILLAVGTALFFIQLIGAASKEWDQIMIDEFADGKVSDFIPREIKKLSMLKILLFFSSEGEFIMDFACLSIGWLLLHSYPGLAVLRCFRVFRLLWCE
jgi:hypothetical protein